MRKPALCVLALLFAIPALAAISQVQSTPNWSCSGTSCAATFTSKPATGDLIAVWTFWQSTGTVTASVNDTLCLPPCSYQSAVGPTVQPSASTPTAAQIFYLKNLQNPGNVSDTVKVTFSGSVSAAGVVIVEYSGADVNYPLDSVSAGYSYSPGNLLDSGTAAPANANLLLFAAGISDNGTLGPGSGFSNIQSHSVGTGSAVTEQNTNPIGGNNALQRATAQLPTTPPPTTGNWIMQMAVFRDSSWTVASGWAPVRNGLVRYCDRYPSLTACVADVDSAGGGTAVVNTQFTLTQNVPFVIGDSNGTPIMLHIAGGAQLVVNISNPSGDAIGIGPGSGISCENGQTLTAQSSGIPCIVPGSSLNVKNLISNQVQSGLGQNDITLWHTWIDDASPYTNGTVTNAVIYFAGLDQSVTADHITVTAWQAPLVKAENLYVSGQPVGGNNGFVFINPYLACEGANGCAHAFWYVSAGNNHGAPGNATVIGGLFEGCKPSPCSQVLLQGGGSYSQDTVRGMTFINPSLETRDGSTLDSGLECSSCANLRVFGGQVSNAGADAIGIDKTVAHF